MVVVVAAGVGVVCVCGGGSLCIGSCSGSSLCAASFFPQLSFFWRTLITHFSGASMMELSIIDSAEQKMCARFKGAAGVCSHCFIRRLKKPKKTTRLPNSDAPLPLSLPF